MTAYSPSKLCHNVRRDRGLRVFSSILLVVVIVLGVLYLVQTNSLVSCSYQIRQHEIQLKELRTAHQKLEMDIAQWHSPANLEQAIHRLGMVEVGKIIYLQEDKNVAAMTR